MPRLLLSYLPALACLLVMAAVCLPMLLGRWRGRSAESHQAHASADEVAALRDEVARLRAQLTSNAQREPEPTA
jgi:hypothetical protein